MPNPNHPAAHTVEHGDYMDGGREDEERRYTMVEQADEDKDSQ